MKNISNIIKSARDIMKNDIGSDELRILQLGWMLFLKIFSDKDKEFELLDNNYTSPIPQELHWSAWAGDNEGITGDELVEFVDRQLFPALAAIDLSAVDRRALLVREVFANNYNHMKSGIYLRQVINKLNEIDFNDSEDIHLFGQIYESFLSELHGDKLLKKSYTPRAITNFMTAIISPQHGEKILDPACGTGGFLAAVIEHLKEDASTVEKNEAISNNVCGWEYKSLLYILANTNLILHDVPTPNIRYGDSLARPLSEYTHKDLVDIILANPPFGGIVSNENEKKFPQTYRTQESADLFLILMINLLKGGGRAAVVLPDGSLTGDGVKERIRQKLLEDCNLHTIVRLPSSVFQPDASAATNLLFFEKGKPTETVWFYQHKLPAGYKSYSKTKPIQLAEFNDLRKWWDDRKANEQAWQVDITDIQADGYNLDIKNPCQPEEEKQYSSGELLRLLRQSLTKSGELVGQLEKEIN